MCLRYFVGHPACNHHEYIGVCYCSFTLCDVDRQQFYYIEDNFPVPCSPGLQTEHITLACSTCVNNNRYELSPDELPVHFYAPTNDFQVREVKRKGYRTPIGIVKAEPKDMQTESVDRDDSEKNSEHHHDSNDGYDYKSLSDTEESEDEWKTSRGHQTTTNIFAAHSNLRDIPNIAQAEPFVPLEHWPATQKTPHYPMPYMGNLALSFAVPHQQSQQPSTAPRSMQRPPRPRRSNFTDAPCRLDTRVPRPRRARLADFVVNKRRR